MYPWLFPSFTAAVATTVSVPLLLPPTTSFSSSSASAGAHDNNTINSAQNGAGLANASGDPNCPSRRAACPHLACCRADRCSSFQSNDRTSAPHHDSLPPLLLPPPPLFPPLPRSACLPRPPAAVAGLFSPPDSLHHHVYRRYPAALGRASFAAPIHGNRALILSLTRLGAHFRSAFLPTGEE